MSILNLCSELMAAPTATYDKKELEFIRRAMVRSGLFELNENLQTERGSV